jgi:hypothetical protein
VAISTSGGLLGGFVGDADSTGALWTPRSKPSFIATVTALTTLAAEDPQNALVVFRPCTSELLNYYLQQVVPNTAAAMAPLDHAIQHELLRAIFGFEITDAERRMLSLPPSRADLNLPIFAQLSEPLFKASVDGTSHLGATWPLVLRGPSSLRTTASPFMQPVKTLMQEKNPVLRILWPSCLNVMRMATLSTSPSRPREPWNAAPALNPSLSLGERERERVA